MRSIGTHGYKMILLSIALKGMYFIFGGQKQIHPYKARTTEHPINGRCCLLDTIL